MDQNTENFNSPFNNRDLTLKGLSILKQPDTTEFRFDEDDTKIRKSKRVSFSARVQIKTIDESINDPATSNAKKEQKKQSPYHLNNSVIPCEFIGDQTTGSYLMDTLNNTSYNELTDTTHCLAFTINEATNDTLRASMITSMVEPEPICESNADLTPENESIDAFNSIQDIDKNKPIESKVAINVPEKIVVSVPSVKNNETKEITSIKSTLQNKDTNSEINNNILKFITAEDASNDKEALINKFREEMSKLRKLNALLNDYTEQKAKEQMELKGKILIVKNENANLKKKIQSICSNTQKEKLLTSLDMNEKLVNEETELKNLKINNQNLSKLSEKNVNLLDKNFELLKKIKEKHEQYEQIVNCNKIFMDILRDYNAPFKLINYTNDSVMLSYFFDLIEIEIDAPGIGSTKQETTRKNKDSFINKIVYKNKIKSDAEDYLKFCNKLIEYELDVKKLSKKYRNFDELPILVAHLNLTCVCAENLANDLKYIKFTYKNVELNMDNFTIRLILNSVIDQCYYELKIWLYPNSYYQEPIVFEINDADDSFSKIDRQRMTNFLQGKYLENGYLKDLLVALE